MAGDSTGMPDIRRVGLIGLGKMGQPMARLLCQRGFAVAGFDVDEGAMEAVAAFGVQTALSPQAVAAASDLVIIAVGFDAEAEAVMFGERGVLAGARDGSVIAIASTVAPHTMQQIVARLPATPAITARPGGGSWWWAWSAKWVTRIRCGRPM